MNFSKVEMLGFKSFADKIEIKFDTGVTCIVGPNGCGKSNIGEAIRWVLGEQSAKSLRGSNMQDVIFSGTKTRKSLSYTEVSLYFDNTNRMFSLDYNEVVITRKLYRSGESEYLVNKNPCRLKDIVDLLHECGIGKEGYSIIGQGKINEIMYAKPEDRRAIFEEATGVAKFKSKKLETERKLLRTRDNVARYNDIILELEKQLVPLSKQAETAKRFLELSENLKIHEVNSYIYKYETASDVKDGINKKIKGYEEEKENNQAESDNLKDIYDENFKKLSNVDEDLNNLHDELLQKTVDIEKQAGEVKVYLERKNYLLKQNSEYKAEMEELQDKVCSLDKTCASLKDENSFNNKKLDDLIKTSDDTFNDFMNVVRKLSAFENETEESRQKVMASMDTMSDIKAGRSSLLAEKSALGDRKEDAITKKSNLNIKINDLENERQETLSKALDFNKKLEDKVAEIANKTDYLEKLEENISKNTQTLYDLNSNVSSFEARRKMLAGIKDNFEGYQYAVKRLLSDAKNDSKLESKIKGVVGGIISSNEKYQVAIETSIGGAIQNIITDTPDDAKYLIEYLKKNRAGRVTFLPLSSIKPRYESEQTKSALREKGVLGLADKLVDYDKYFENAVKYLLGNTIIVDTIENGVALANKYKFSFKIVTLEGDIFSPQGSMTGGSKKSDTVSLLGNDRELEKVSEELESMKKTMARVKQETFSMEEEQEELSNAIHNLEKTKREFENISLKYEQNIERIDGLIAETKSGMLTFDGEIMGIEGRIKAIEIEIKKIDESDEEVSYARKNVDSKLEKQHLESEILKKERERLNDENLKLKVQINEVKNDITRIIADSERLENDKTLALEKIGKDRYTVNGNTEMIANLDLSIENVGLKEEDKKRVGDIRTELNNLDNFKRELSEKIADSDRRRAVLLSEINKLVEKIQNQQIALAKVDSDIEFMQSRIFEEYQLSYQTALDFKEEDYDINSGATEITKLKRQIANLGSVNPNAIEDYSLTNQRYGEMSLQRDDLVKGQEDLQKVISTLTGEMLNKFNDGFKRIQENFTITFKELFGGGTAKLVLEDSVDNDDPLSAGIEIEAQPPGKTLRKLSLLSGGEMALTAIAILFAILRVFPMPFCLLDEIDAALDEANVVRFASYLKKFSTGTQFIVISHRKQTMELADSLYGVTMQEKGISKVVSVKLSDVSGTINGL